MRWHPRRPEPLGPYARTVAGPLHPHFCIDGIAVEHVDDWVRLTMHGIVIELTADQAYDLARDLVSHGEHDKGSDGGP